jgi:DNA modification methylase
VLDRLLDIDWAFTESKTGEHVHSFHPYPARFIPQIPAAFIRELSEPGQTVFDPFCGAGTTLVEATLQGRNAIGNDLNPLAVLMSRVKTNVLTAEQIALLNHWQENVAAVQGPFARREVSSAELDMFTQHIPDIPHIERWFSPTVCHELSFLRLGIDQFEDRAVKDFCFVAFSAIIVRVSNQDSETRYVSRPKDISAGATIAAFLRKLNEMRSKMSQYANRRVPDAVVHVFCGNAQEMFPVEPATVHLVVTSPPYPNAFDYHLYHRFRMFWLGYDPVAMSKQEIGSHLNYQRNGDGIDTYCRDMTQCFRQIQRVLLPGAMACFVIGDSLFHGKLIEDDVLLTDIATECGFVLERNIERPLHRQQRSFAHVARRLQEEHLLVFRKVGHA